MDAPQYSCTIVSDRASLEEHLTSWQSCWEYSAFASVFNHPAFCLAWYESIGVACGVVPVLASLFQNNHLAGVFPLCRFPQSEYLTVFGGEDFADYHEVLIDQRIVGQIDLGKVFEAVGREIDYPIVLARVRKPQANQIEASVPAAVVTDAMTHSYGVSIRNLQNPDLALLRHGGRTFLADTYRCRKNLQADVGYTFEWYDSPAMIVEELIEFVRGQTKLRYLRTGAPDLTLTPGYERFLSELVVRGHRYGVCFAVALKTFAGEVFSAQLGFAANKQIFWYLPAYDPLYRRYSPGRLLIFETILASAARGYAYFDFTWGDDDYKTKWCGTGRPLYRVLYDKRSAADSLSRCPCPVD